MTNKTKPPQKSHRSKPVQENYTNLRKYFKVVKTCSACKKEYGCDIKKDNGLCPKCCIVFGIK